jgi:hypothetical protein
VRDGIQNKVREWAAGQCLPAQWIKEWRLPVTVTNENALTCQAAHLFARMSLGTGEKRLGLILQLFLNKTLTYSSLVLKTGLIR